MFVKISHCDLIALQAFPNTVTLQVLQLFLTHHAAKAFSRGFLAISFSIMSQIVWNLKVQ
jgi:hypothetical protein